MKSVIIITITVVLFFPIIVFADLPNSQYKDEVYSLKSSYYELSREIRSTITQAEEALSGLGLENSDAKKKTDTAWDIRWTALTKHESIETDLSIIETNLKNRYYQTSFNQLLGIDKQLYAAKDDLYAISSELKQARDLEKQYQENNRNCFLFWCSEIKDTYSIIDPKIQDLESKLNNLESKFKNLEKNQNTQIQSLHKKEIELKEQEILKLQNEQRQQQYEAELQEQRLQEQIKQEQLEAQRQEQLRQQQEYDAQRQKQQLQGEITQKEKQKIIEQSRTNPVIKGLIDGTIYFYIEPIPSYYKVPGIYGAVDEIAGSLERTFYGIKIQRTYNENNADIHISWIKDFGSSTLGHAIFKRYVEIGLGENNCFGDWQPYTIITVKKILWHEIGHSLGYSHSGDPNNIMYAYTQSQFYGNESHSFTLKTNYNQWFNFCDSGIVGFKAQSSVNTDGFDVFAIPPNDPYDFSHNGGSVYLTTDGENCGKRDVISITRYCDVGSGAFLHFKNKESHPIFITFEFINTNPYHWPNMIWDSDVFEYSTSYINYVRSLF